MYLLVKVVLAIVLYPALLLKSHTQSDKLVLSRISQLWKMCV